MARTGGYETEGRALAEGPGSDRAREASSIEVRPCGAHAELEACVRLQVETWGEGYRDLVAGSLLKVAVRVGGVVVGAFLPTGEVAGFVFGLTGVENGRLVHWSHMMAVSPSYRDRGVGTRLKAYQRRVLRGLGVERAYWTFDPLVARNAHLNLNRLSVRFEEYVPDMYADTGSGLHAFGTDRFVVSWPVSDGAGEVAGRVLDSVGTFPVVNVDGSGRPVVVGDGRSPVAVVDGGGPVGIRIGIPSDIEPMIVTDLGLLRAWRRSTRSAFERCLGAGYALRGFLRGAETGWYVLERGNGAG